jgi:hypothetical protein
MRRLPLALALLLLLAAVGSAAIATNGLTHRWQFTEMAAPYLDSVGGDALTVMRGTVVSVAGETGGLMSGVMLGSAAGTDSGAVLHGTTNWLAGDKAWTLEIIYRIIGGKANVNDYGNIFAVSNAPFAATPRGVLVNRYMDAGSTKKTMGLVGNGGQGTKQLDHATIATASEAERGALQHFVITSDSTTGLAAYYAPLGTASIGAAKKTDATVMNAMTDTHIFIGDSLNNVGQIHIVEVRMYQYPISATIVQSNHDADRVAYLNGDLWVSKGAVAYGYGTQTRPLDEVTQAWQRVSNGWTIHAAAGTYAPCYLTTDAGKPSASTGIAIEGVDGDSSAVVIHGTATTDYPFSVAAGSWTLNDLTLDAENTSYYAAFATAATVDTLKISGCLIRDTATTTSNGTGVMSRAKVTRVDGCRFELLDEHGVYLRNQTSAADYAGSWIKDSVFDGCLKYGIQTSNGDPPDTTYQYTGLVISGNTITGAAGTTSGGISLGGVDGATSVRNNLIDMTAATEAVFGISLSTSGYVGARNATINNNEIRGCYAGLTAGGATGTYKPVRDKIHNNFLVDCTSEWVVGAMVGAYKLSNNCGVGGTTPFPDSTGTFADSTSWRMEYGGKKGLAGMTDSAQGFQRVGISLDSPGQPIIGKTQPGFRYPVEALTSIRSVGALKGVTLEMYAPDPQSRANLKVWEFDEHPAAGGGTYQSVAADTLKIRRAVQ